jgi:type VI secretion system protein
MSLLLTITAAPAGSTVPESSKTFDVTGGTIGRGNQNAWILDDPERFLSSLHCQISAENGQYYLTDLSTNGTFFNGSPDPMGKGCKLPLQDGDKFSLGDYEFSVSLWNQAAATTSTDSGAGAMVGASDPFELGSPDPFSQPAGNNDFDHGLGSTSSPFDTGYVSKSDSLFNVSPEESDPLIALDKAREEHSFGASGLSGSSGLADPFENSTSYSDQADPMNQQISWPESVTDTGGGVIPDDWDDDLLSPQPSTTPQSIGETVPSQEPSIPAASEPSPLVMPKPGQRKSPPVQTLDVEPEAPPTKPKLDEGRKKPALSKSDIAKIQRKAMEQAKAKVEAELDALRQQVQSLQRGNGGETTVDNTLVDILGFGRQNLTDEQIVQINAKAGEVIRESINGLMRVLSSRSAIKNEFRMNVTTIQPVENNPLKFSANVDDALENMFIKQGNAYKKPIEAVQEGFESIAEHQVAIIAGIRAAFKGVIERFDPITLETRFSKTSKSGLIPGMQKAKNWDLYSDYYTEIVGDLDNSFQYLFGDEFVQAYEDQLRKLAVAKKSKSKDK